MELNLLQGNKNLVRKYLKNVFIGKIQSSILIKNFVGSSTKNKQI